HDALNAIDGRFAAYTPGLPPAPGASADAAVAAAAHDTLIALVPDQAARVLTAYEQALAGDRDGAAKSAGIATGKAAAMATLNRRQSDGFATAGQPDYVPRHGAGEYQFTTPFDFALLPQLGHAQPFVIELRDHPVA